MKTFDVRIPSRRKAMIHATIVESDCINPGLILFAHGFKAERTEDGRFISVAHALAEKGINSITADFSGCGESEESFDFYSLTNCLDDLESLYAYMRSHYQIDENRLAIVGYSMGGRTACLWVEKHPEFHNLCLWAAASYNAFGGNEMFLDNPVSQMLAEMNEKGYAVILNSFDHTLLHLSRQFLDDISEKKPFDALSHYQGNVLLVHGTADTMVDPSVSKMAFENLTTRCDKKLVLVEGANHGFGIWDNHPEQSAQLTNTTIQFLEEHLRETK